jgi:hypothetical protein
MPIEAASGDILADLKHGDAVVIPVNCKGVAGAGLAKQWRDRYYNHYENYPTERKPRHSWRGGDLIDSSDCCGDLS